MSLPLISFHTNPAIIFLRSLANDGSTNPANNPPGQLWMPSRGLESSGGEQAAAHLAALLGPPPCIPPAPGTRIISSPAFRRGEGLADAQLSLECVQTRSSAGCCLPPSPRPLGEGVKASLFCWFRALRIVFPGRRPADPESLCVPFPAES